MILGFKTTINDKPTYFVERILKGMQRYYLSKNLLIHLDQFNTIDDNVLKAELKPKLHTIREDKTDKWHAGVMIDFFINVRTKKMYRFAPRIPCVSTQKICIEYIFNNFSNECKPAGQRKDNHYPVVFIDNEWSNSDFQLKQLAQTDGFDTIEEFFVYFNTDFTGKIIHWTDLKY
jgi:hypothetical protein